MKTIILLICAFLIYSINAGFGLDCTATSCDAGFVCSKANLCVKQCVTGSQDCAHYPNSVCKVLPTGGNNGNGAQAKYCTIITTDGTKCTSQTACKNGQTCDEYTLTCYMPTGNPGNNGNPAKLGQACPGNTKCLDKTVCSTAKFCVEPCTKDSDCGASAPTGSCAVVAGGTDKACTNHNTHNACTPGDPPKCGIGKRCNKFTMNCESGKNLGQECDTTDDCLLRLVCNPTITDGSKSVCTAACGSNSECTLPNGTTKRCSQTSASPTALATGYCEINKKMECHKNNQCSKRCNTHILQCNN